MKGKEKVAVPVSGSGFAVGIAEPGFYLFLPVRIVEWQGHHGLKPEAKTERQKQNRAQLGEKGGHEPKFTRGP